MNDHIPPDSCPGEPLAEHNQDLEILTDAGTGTHVWSDAWSVYCLARDGGEAGAALDLLLEERAGTLPSITEEPGGPGFGAALRRIAADVARYRAGHYQQPSWWGDYNRARLRLDALAREALAGPAALVLLSRFAREDRCASVMFDSSADADIEIEGARIFGHLLHLAGHPVSAAFWWRIAAGAGDPQAAFALYLQHLVHGELDEAEWWLDQTCDLPDSQEDSPAPGLPAMPGYFRVLPTVMPPWHTSENVEPAASLAGEVDRLVMDGDSEGDDVEGIVRRPGPSMANRLEELAGR